jgi:uncharacterized membrane protein
VAAALSDAQVLDNAKAACAEIRVQIDYQMKAGDSVDTKAWGLVTVTGVAAGLVAQRLHFSDVQQGWAAFVVFVVAMALVVFSILAVRPRSHFSFGVDPGPLVDNLESYATVGILLAMATSLRKARDLNAAALDRKVFWYTLALAMLGLLLVGLAWLVYLRAVQ